MSDTPDPAPTPDQPPRDGDPVPGPDASAAPGTGEGAPPFPPTAPPPSGPGHQPTAGHAGPGEPFAPGQPPGPFGYPAAAGYAPGTGYPAGPGHLQAPAFPHGHGHPHGAGPTPPPPPGMPGDMWLRPPGMPGTGASGGAQGPPHPGAPFPPWTAGGHWGPPGGWGNPPVWLPPPHPAPRNHPLRVLGVALLVVMIAAVGVAVGRTTIQTGPGFTGGSSSGTSLPGDAATIAAKVDPGVVDITTRLGFQDGEAAGTGMVLTSSGVVLTNNHVVDGATSISVTDVGNGQSYTATVVGTDATDDVAVLRLQGASGLKTVSIGNSSSLSVGQELTAIGNAGGVGGTPSVAAGTVTALDQSITATDESDQSSEQLTGLIETDAALQPGDSGGPLVNSSGLVVGMDTAASSGFQFQGGGSQGFSIPINKAVSIARQMTAGQSSNTVHIGPSALIGVDVEPDSSTPGALVVGVQAGSPADSVGIVAGDVITSLGGQSVDSPTTLRNLMARHHPGDKVQLGWTDQSGASQSATVQLVTGPAA